MERGSEEELNGIRKFLKENIVFLILLLMTVAFFCIFFFTKVSGESMCDTLPDGKLVLCCKLGTPERGDVVVCDIKWNEISPPTTKRLIKRVIACGGDVIDIREEGGVYRVYVNGEQLDELYIREPMTYMPDIKEHNPMLENWQYPLTVPEGTYFVMGDNRNKSSDSRDVRYGLIPESNIAGIVLFH